MLLESFSDKSAPEKNQIFQNETGLQYDVSMHGNVTEVSLKGRMCFSDHNIFSKIMSTFDVNPGHQIVFNLSKLDYVDSSGLGMFLIADDEARRKSIKFRIVSPKSEVQRIFALGKLDRILDVKS
ncbi:hypothetical protein CCP2SC5_460007 [Azospirillaceae bacterium]